MDIDATKGIGFSAVPKPNRAEPAAVHHRIDHAGGQHPDRDAGLSAHGVTRSRRALR